METAGKPAERQEMATVKECKCTLVAEDIDYCVSQIDCLCEWLLVNVYLVNLNCRHRVVAR